MVSIIAARSRNNCIGKNGTIPWHIKGEMKQFKDLTTGQAVIMGRKTYEDIGHPLPDRLTVVVSNTKTYTDTNLVTVKSFAEALNVCDGKEIFVGGGYRIFAEALEIADRLYITEIDLDVEDGDVFFPEFDEKLYAKELLEVNTDTIPYTRYLYIRKPQ